jgi:thiol-disulfide isomerase/thioredoxin
MRPALSFLWLLSVVSLTLHAQDRPAPTLNIGDPAPPLRLREWLKGTPIQSFEKGRIYVVEFWAVWCAPCRAAIPRLSALAEKYRGEITFVGIDVQEQGINSFEKVKAFVDSMGNRMNYPVAAEDSNLMAETWQKASGHTGMPGSFVVNAEGRLAWIGHPMNLDKVLPRIVKNKWDIQKALAKRNLDRYLDSLDGETFYRLFPYRQSGEKPEDPGKTELTLVAINSILINEPRLKYAPRMAYQTFTALLKTNPQEAYKYGKAAIVTPTYEEPAFAAIISAITTYSENLQLPREIFILGAEAYQKQIDWIPYPENVDMHKYYSKMADWYSRGGKKSKAKEARQKAEKALKSKKDYSSK